MNLQRLILKSVARRAICLSTALAISGLCAGSLAAQRTQPRITAHIDDSARVVLNGSVRALAQPQWDLGDAPANRQMTHVRLLLARTTEQEAALTALLDALEDKSSPSYHRWLAPEQFGKLFGPADEDVAAITAWLESEGFVAVVVPKGRQTIELSGPVGLVEQVFHTSIHSFSRDGEEYIANVSDPSIPAAIAPVIAGMLHLDTIEPRSYMVHGPAGRYDVATRQIVPAESDAGGEEPRPDYTTSIQGRTVLAMVAGDAATMYNTPNKKLNANFSGTNYDGTGVTIGIGGVAPIETTPIANYRKLFLGDSKLPTVTNVDGVTSTNAADEAYLDIELAGALAPGASIHYYTAKDLTSGITKMLDDNSVDIFSLSFGLCEKNMGNTLNQAVLNEWKQASTQGIAVIVASGDSGSAGCDSKNDNIAYYPMAVSGYSTTPYNLAVGGTDTYGLVGDFSGYVSATGSAAQFYRSALKPIPESTWNDSQDTPGPISAAIESIDTVHGGGGGASSCSTQSSAGACGTGYAKPSWQKGKGVPADKVRDVPDVSLMAGAARDGALWLVCDGDLGTTCTKDSTGKILSGYTGGTSASAPAFAGMLALVEQKQGKRLGQAAAEIYSLAGSAYGTRVFNDITLGNNAPPCLAGSTQFPDPDCKANKAAADFLVGYNAGTGYDLATGLGSVNAANLVEFWDAPPPLPVTVTVKPAAASIFRGNPLVVTVTVAGKSGAPTGIVTLSSGGFVSAARAVAGGVAKITIPASVLTAGADTLTVSYSGDSKFNTAKGSAKVTVTLLTPTVKVTPAATNLSRAKSLLVSIKVAASIGTPTGTVTLASGTYKSAATALVNGAVKITVPADSLTAGKETLTATYKGAGNYKAAIGSVKLTVTK